MEVFENLNCYKCKLLLSVSPITYSNGFLCGRCSQGEIENRVWCYEKIATFHLFPCKYTVNGCATKLKFDTIGKHEETCDWRQIKCPLCKVIILENNVRSHVKSDHSSEFFDSTVIPLNIKEIGKQTQKLLTVADIIYYVNIKKNSDGLNLRISYFGKNFDRYYTKYNAKIYSETIADQLTFLNKNVERFKSKMNQITISQAALTYFTSDNSNHTIYLELNFAPELEELAQKDFLLLVECPICFNYMSEIGQCYIGHSFCKKCLAQLSRCPICGSDLTASTNYLAENLTKVLQFPCKNHNFGCFYTGPLYLREKHQENCYVCPSIPQCNMVGELEEIVEHCLTHHNVWEGSIENALCTLSRNKIERLFFVDNSLFKYCREFVGNVLHWTVLYFGPAENEELYQYSITILSNQRSWKFSNKCLLYSRDYGVVEQYFKMPADILETFIDENKIICNINIEKIN